MIAHRLVCPGTVDERVEEVVAGKRHIADLVLPKSSSLGDLDSNQLRVHWHQGAGSTASTALLDDPYAFTELLSDADDFEGSLA